ncbi:MAG: DUF726 domain-containing protein [Sulfuricurvum sp.]|nr:DUF726 domain-containing protein [Sulfuricurvum sp.]
MSNLTKILYVHGFGGRDNAPTFMVNMNNFHLARRLQYDLSAFSWDSGFNDPKILCAEFLSAEANAIKAGNCLFRHLEECESNQQPYYLVGFSLGALVVSSALMQAKACLNLLRGVFLMGAAMPSDIELPGEIIPSNVRCHNYYSSAFDKTLSILYKNIKGKDAAGKEDLNHPSFSNLHVNCTHHLIPWNSYDNLAEAVGYLIAWDDKIMLNEKSFFNIPLPTGGGNTHWNDVCYYKEHKIQQNIHTNHYRAIDSDCTHTRKAWGKNLHTVLCEL